MRGIIAVIAPLCLSACAAGTPNDPIFVLAQSIDASKTGCRAAVTGDFQRASGTQAICGDGVQRRQSAFDNQTVAARTRHDSQRVALASSERAPWLNGPDRTNVVPNVIPTLDIEVRCQDAADIANDRNVNRCVSDERSARDELARKWTAFPASYRSQCARYVSRSGGGTYTDLLTCLEMGLHAHELSERGRQGNQAAN